MTMQFVEDPIEIFTQLIYPKLVSCHWWGFIVTADDEHMSEFAQRLCAPFADDENAYIALALVTPLGRGVLCLLNKDKLSPQALLQKMKEEKLSKALLRQVSKDVVSGTRDLFVPQTPMGIAMAAYIQMYSHRAEQRLDSRGSNRVQ